MTQLIKTVPKTPLNEQRTTESRSMCGGNRAVFKRKYSLSGHQLQFLLYYCQAWCLVTQDRPLFLEHTRALEHGAVAYEVARAHRGRRSVVAADIPGSPESVLAEDQAVIDAVLESYGSLSGDELEQLSHSEEPWQRSYNGETRIASGAISKDSIEQCYASLMASDAETQRKHHVPQFPIAPRMYVSDEDYDRLPSIL